MTDGESILPVVTAILAFLGTVFTGIMAYLVLRLKGQQEEAAKRSLEAVSKVNQVVDQVSALATTKADNDSKLEEIRKLVDGGRTALVLEIGTLRSDVLRLEKESSKAEGLVEHALAPSPVLYTAQQVADLMSQQAAKLPPGLVQDAKNVLVPRAKVVR